MNTKRYGVCVAVVVFGAVLLGGHSALAAESSLKTLERIEAAFVEVVDEVLPAVVNIGVDSSVEPKLPVIPEGHPLRDLMDQFRSFGQPGPQPRRFEMHEGSGFIVEKDGYILTNNHVVEGADKISVKVADRGTFEAEVVGRDPKTDIALLKIDAGEDLPVAKLGDSDEIKVGQFAIAIGSAKGLEGTVTVGHISAIGRSLGDLRPVLQYQDFIQTDAPINMGNSGGPLVNIKGQVIGMNTAMAPFAQSVGFSIPINMATRILPQLKDEGRVIRAYLGVSIEDVAPELVDKLDLPDTKGALVNQVMEGTPADDAGLEVYDVIRDVDGETVESAKALQQLVSSMKPGTTVKIKLVRDGEEKTLRVKLMTLPESEEDTEVARREKMWGLRVRSADDMSREMRERTGIDLDEGVIVTDVEPGSAGFHGGIREGDVILEIDRKPVKDARAFSDMVKKIKPGETVIILVQREDNTFILHLKVEEPKK
jgi:serine protease Do